MKIRKQILFSLLSIMVTIFLFSEPVYAKTGTNTIDNAARSDSSVYCNVHVKKIEHDFQIDSESAERAYKKLNIALLGAIKKIEHDGKSVQLKTSSEEMSVLCKIDDKLLREEVAKLIEGGYIIVAGSVTKATSKSFVIKAHQITPVSTKTVPSFDGKTDAFGHIYTQAELFERSIHNIEFFSINTWSEIDAKRFKKYQLGPLENELHFDLSDGEFLDIYFLDWEKLLTAAKSANDRREDRHRYIPSLSDEERCRDYLTGEWLPGVKVLNKNQGTKITRNCKFKFYICTRKDNAQCVLSYSSQKREIDL